MSSLIEKLQKDLKDALKGGDRARAGALRYLLSELNYARIEKQADLEDSDVLAVLKKQAKKRRESIDAFTAGARDDLVAKESLELELIESYLPEQLGEEEIRELLRNIIREEGMGGASDMGRLMKKAMESLKGRADGSLVNRLAGEELQRSGD